MWPFSEKKQELEKRAEPRPLTNLEWAAYNLIAREFKSYTVNKVTMMGRPELGLLRSIKLIERGRWLAELVEMPNGEIFRLTATPYIQLWTPEIEQTLTQMLDKGSIQ